MKANKIGLPQVETFLGYGPKLDENDKPVMDADGRPVIVELTREGNVAHAMLQLVASNPGGASPDEVMRAYGLSEVVRKAIAGNDDHLVVSTDELGWLRKRLDAAKFENNDAVTATLIRVIRDAEEIDVTEKKPAGSRKKAA